MALNNSYDEQAVIQAIASALEIFYGTLIEYMGTMPEKYVADYKESYNRAANRLVREFANSFCREDGSIDWEKLVEFNSGD